MRVALAQINTTVGDIPANIERASQALERAVAGGAELVVFPELTITGYPPEDLLLRPSLALRVEQALQQLQTVQGIVMVVGYPDQQDGQCLQCHR